MSKSLPLLVLLRLDVANSLWLLAGAVRAKPEHFSPDINELARRMQVLSYESPGVGLLPSDLDDLPPTLAKAARRLLEQDGAR